MTERGTLTRLFFDAVERHRSLPAALRYKAGGMWKSITHDELAGRVHHVAVALREAGYRPGDRIGILSENRPEWAIADYACLTARLVDVPVYPTLNPRQIAYVLRDSGARAVFVSTEQHLTKVLEVRDELPALDRIVVFDADAATGDVVPLEAFEQAGAEASPRHPRYREEALAVGPDDLATLIYTSGTTGDPKGVMLTHDNFYSNVKGALAVLPLTTGDECLSFLPLSHSFERTAGHYIMFDAGVIINYAESIDAVAQNMREVRPTVMVSVPRLYEKIYARVLDSAMAGGALKRAIFQWSKRNAEAWADYAADGRSPPALLNLKKAIADRLVFRTLRARTGGRLRLFVSGGAPLSPVIAKFFYAAGLPILEGYGLTETAPVLSVNPAGRVKIGTVGRAIPGVALRIADDGEILARGPNIMRGYFNKPEATRDAIDDGGWFHTGDIGELDGDGYLRITDRKKDIIVTAGGKNIAPQPIENAVKTNKFVLNAVMLGDKRKFPVILVVPDLERLWAWARERNLAVGDDDALLELPDVKAKMEREVMGQLRDLAKFEMPKRVVLLRDDFTVESGELTPTLKVKRRVVEQKHKDVIERGYQEAEGAVVE